MPSAWLSGAALVRTGLIWVIEELVPDGLWERVEALLPPRPRRRRYPGRRPVGDRAALAGIVFVLKTGIAWNQLPTGLVGCSGVTCWRGLRDWTEAGVWPAFHELLLAEPRATDRLDLDRCAVDGSHIRALKGGPRRPLAGRPRASRLQAPSDLRRRRHPAGRHAHRRQPQRHHPAHPTAGCRAAHIDGHFRVRHDKIDTKGKLTLRHNSRLHHIGRGRRYAGTPVLVLVHDLHIRELSTSGQLLRDLNLDPSRDYQPQAPK
jgi:transposase